MASALGLHDSSTSRSASVLIGQRQWAGSSTPSLASYHACAPMHGGTETWKGGLTWTGARPRSRPIADHVAQVCLSNGGKPIATVVGGWETASLFTVCLRPCLFSPSAVGCPCSPQETHEASCVLRVRD